MSTCYLYCSYKGIGKPTDICMNLISFRDCPLCAVLIEVLEQKILENRMRGRCFNYAAF